MDENEETASGRYSLYHMKSCATDIIGIGCAMRHVGCMHGGRLCGVRVYACMCVQY